MNPKRAQRLKDTCDRCSASKIRCGKQRPQCSRCDNLGYRCFYSAARRKGRPHPGHNEDAQSAESVEPVERSPKQQENAAEPTHTSVQTELQGMLGPTHNTRAKNVLEQQQQQHRGSSNFEYQQDLIPNYQQGTSACKDWANTPFYNNAESFTSTTETSSPDMLLSHPESPSVDLDSNADTSTKAWSGKSSYSDDSSNTECSDCTLLATKTLQHLTTTSGQPPPQIPSSSSSPFPHLDFDRPTLDARIHTALTAIKRLSAILICPCSCSPDVGLLCAALCAAILDSYWTILRSSTGSGSQGSADVDSIMTSGFGDLNSTISIINDVISSPDYTQLGAESPGRRVNQQVIVRRVLEELPKAANVVMQFTRRYNDTGEAAVSENGKEDVALLLPTLAVGQRTRLKGMVDKATSLLVLAE